jgi:primosomal protein N' (replication factor Y)
VAIFGSATPRPGRRHALERLELGGRIAAPLPTVRVSTCGTRRATRSLRRSSPSGSPCRGRREGILLLNPAVSLRSPAAPAARPPLPERRRLPLHGDGTLRCHHCGTREPARETCPDCGSPGTRAHRRGHAAARAGARNLPELERIGSTPICREARARRARRCVRRSRRPPRHADGREGHHFAGVELAAVVDADTSLGLPDFRAEERTFQLLTQLAGRSDRDARTRPHPTFSGVACGGARGAPRRRRLPRR